MAFSTYNNNKQDDRPTTNTYTPIAFSNPNSKVQQSRLDISYFNKMMVVSIHPRINQGSNDIPRFDNDNPVKVYISFNTAKLLHDAAVDMFTNGKMNNVCVETKNGLFKISNGVEFGSTSPCISITHATQDGGEIVETVYQTKDNYTVAYDYADGAYSEMNFPMHEMDTILMTFEQYYIASSYAIATSIRDAEAYKYKYVSDIIKGIATKVGAPTDTRTNTSNGSFSSHTFLNGGGANQGNSNAQSGGMNGVPKGYEQSSFDDIVNSMGGYSDDD